MESKELSALFDGQHSHHLISRSKNCAFCELIDWAKGKSLPEVWEQCPRTDWLIWLCGKMAGNEGWPTAVEIVVAVRALAGYSPRFELQKAIEIANRWMAGRASLEELCDEIERAVTAYGRTGNRLQIPGYGRFDGLKDAADIVRRALKTPGACLEHKPRSSASHRSSRWLLKKTERVSTAAPHDSDLTNAIVNLRLSLDSLDSRLEALENEESYTGRESQTLTDFESRLEAIEAEATATAARNETHREATGGFWVFGAGLAMLLSWSRNGSILYCIGHGILSWFYVIYFAVTR